MIRLTTNIGISTMAAYDMSATINYLCFQTGYKNLYGYIYGSYKEDLLAYIKGVVLDYAPKNLSASVGYSDSYTVEDKFRLNITINPSTAITEDVYRFVFNVYRAGSLLSAYIKGIQHYSQLSSEITGTELDIYYYDDYIKNIERVLHKTYDGIFRYYQFVEISFKSIVSDYYYSPGGYAWKKDRLEKWIAELRSFLPYNPAIRIGRKARRIVALDDLRRFNTVDDAMKWAIYYVTEYPNDSLTAIIRASGSHSSLAANLSVKETHSNNSSLSSSITPEDVFIIVGTSSGLTRL
jgi:hypothetical protein